jgi:hypothetical protein
LEGIWNIDIGIDSVEKLCVCVVISMRVTSPVVPVAGVVVADCAGGGGAGFAFFLFQAFMSAPPRAEPGIEPPRWLLASPDAVCFAVSFAT